MTTYWILVANSTEATIYSALKTKLSQNNAALEKIKAYTNLDGREKTHDHVSDKMGNYHHKAGGQGSFVESTDPKQYEFDRFARKLADELNKGRIKNAYQELIIIAPPHFHGMLNKHIDSHTKALVGINIEKDYVHLKSKELETTLIKFL